MVGRNTFIAHSANIYGETQSLKEHGLGVGELMKQFALSDSFTDMYEFCGLIHDLGKYSDDFQRYIAGSAFKTNHSIYGALFASNNHLLEIAFPIYGHHAGLPDGPIMYQKLKALQKSEKKTYDSICESWHSDIGHRFILPKDNSFLKIPNVLQQELFVRMLYSALVDADSLDTERHFDLKKYQQRKTHPLDANYLLGKLQQKLNEFGNDPEKNKLDINILRNEVRSYAESKAAMPQGCFSLTLPTGLGKTICSINWALHHACTHKNIKRIILVLPFISIIDQTSEVLKSIFNDKENDYVLEHHSNIIYENDENNEDYNPQQLAIENWDYPIIVTTSVQFFESLFSNKRSMCRKLHNIQDSIIIFDEIQTLPLNITEPTLTMLDNLQQLCRCSILFCTATQPDFETRDGFSGIDHIESLVENPKLVFEQTRRVIFHPVKDYDGISISELANMVHNTHQSALVVFNTKKKARIFFDEIKSLSAYKSFHLSTSMCPFHRKEIIKKIRRALQNNEYIIVSSTQLIEAGVDMDFPTVYRELAPLESIIQSAGRCNREGRMCDMKGNKKSGDVFLFSLIEHGQPSREYHSFSEFANLLYKGNETRLYTHDFYSYYYRKLVRTIANTDEFGITRDRKKLLYQTISEKYKIIKDKTQAIFVYTYNDDSQKIYSQIKDLDYLTKQELQHVSQYCVQVYDGFLKANRSFCNLEKCGILVWYGKYSEEYGLPTVEEFKPIIL